MDEDKVVEWLNKSGYIFEIKCVDAFKSAGFKVESSVHYYDHNSNVHREVDFLAYKSITLANLKYSFNICFVVECKSHIEPIIAVSSFSNLKKETVLANLLCSNNVAKIQKSILSKGGLNNFTFGIQKEEIIPQTIIAYTGGSNKLTDNKKDRVYESMMQSLNASLFLRDTSNKLDTRFSNIYIPVVVFDNKLSVANSIKSEINLSNVDYLKVSKLYAFNDHHPYVFFHIVSSFALERYCSQIASDVDDFLEKYESEITEIAKSSPNNTGSGKYFNRFS